MSGIKDVYTVPEAAEYCAVDRGTMRRWVISGKLKAYATLGGHYRIRGVDLEKFLLENNLYPLAERHFIKNKILIVDDDYVFQQDISGKLASNEYITEVADDGFEAGIKVKEFQPDLIILDLFMPIMDGFEVCRHIKEDTTKSHIKIIVLTGESTKENREKAMNAGADLFLNKPVDENVLIQYIENLLLN